MANKKLRELMKKEKIYIWQIAEVIGVHETTLIKRFRTELSREDVELIMSAIQRIKQHRTVVKG